MVIRELNKDGYKVEDFPFASTIYAIKQEDIPGEKVTRSVPFSVYYKGSADPPRHRLRDSSGMARAPFVRLHEHVISNFYITTLGSMSSSPVWDW